MKQLKSFGASLQSAIDPLVQQGNRMIGGAGVEASLDDRFEIQRKLFQADYKAVLDMVENLKKHILGITHASEGLTKFAQSVVIFNGEDKRVAASDKFNTAVDQFATSTETYLTCARSVESNLKQYGDLLAIHKKEIQERDRLAIDWDKTRQEIAAEQKKPAPNQTQLSMIQQRHDAAKMLYEKRNEEVLVSISTAVANRSIHNDYQAFVVSLSTFFQNVAQTFAVVAAEVSRAAPPPTVAVNVPASSSHAPAAAAAAAAAAPPLPQRAVPPPPTQRQAKALYAFKAEQPGELSLNPGDIVTLDRTTGDWWTGTVNGRSGEFPSNYVQQL